MNHFFALRLSEEARQTVDSVVSEWRSAVMPASWYEPTDYHITLKFLGDVNEAEQVHLKEAAEPIAARTPPFLVDPKSFGAFPNVDNPNVLWAGVNNNPELDLLRMRLDKAMSALGFRADHRLYQPHITLARCDPKNKQSVSLPLNERLFAPFVVSRLVLMETLPPEERANGTKARYNTVHTFPFGNRQSDVS